MINEAARAGEVWRTRPAAERADVLDRVADALLAAADDLWPVAARETSLGEVRLRGEIARSAVQFRLFAGVLRDGGHVEAIIDHADPSATPPKPDVRRMFQPVPGVVGVFAASNFPFAFSVAGGDVASALAAGCAVVVKAHPGHPELSRRVAEVMRAALPDPDLLGLLEGFEAGKELVQHPLVSAVGFTGSLRGGKAIQALIDERPDPIPFYGELGSVNPVVVLPSALADPVGLAEGFAASLTLGVGQFCTNPGLLFVPDDADLLKAITAAVSATTGGTMLTPAICEGFESGVSRLDERLTELARGLAGSAEGAVAPRVYTADLTTFSLGLPEFAEETFGPSAIVVTYKEITDLPEVLRNLPGSLTATLHSADPVEAAPLVPELARLAGRVIWNGWPTGVAVTWAMHHGGPWPASTTPMHTSVGATAIRRWQTPVAYQDLPEPLLPLELRDDNPLGIPRRVDGALSVG
ncbi:aldehyde dehydrogenase (NADP(+)) [Herbidospora daliensis]|uniref:aldehyde dehydrogenase (NADP(+)) n=1 Tax=Herbidospora daliensis TaxID=295585 RepID=UPI0007843DAD|nr:aldehyde dehydrogenase (NADP(+)) [Herbidospora daliensis]